MRVILWTKRKVDIGRSCWHSLFLEANTLGTVTGNAKQDQTHTDMLALKAALISEDFPEFLCDQE